MRRRTSKIVIIGVTLELVIIGFGGIFMMVTILSPELMESLGFDPTHATIFGISVFIGPILIFLVVIIIMAAMGKFTPEDNYRKLSLRVADWAQNEGYSYKPYGTKTIEKILHHTPISGYMNRKARLLVYGTINNRDIYNCHWTYEYIIETKNGKERHSAGYLITAVHAGLTGGTLMMRFEDLNDRMKAKIGIEDLDFENKEFSDRYFIKARPDRFGYEFFSPRMIELFLSTDVPFKLYIQDGWLIFNMHVHMGEMTPDKKMLGIEHTPYEEWLLTMPDIAASALDILPRFISNAEEVEPISLDAMEVVCPQCNTDFFVEPKEKSIKCPHCGVEGEM